MATRANVDDGAREANALRTFLRDAKEAFARDPGACDVSVGNEACDLDSVACAVATARAASAKRGRDDGERETRAVPIVSCAREELKLRPDVVLALANAGVELGDLTCAEDVAAAATKATPRSVTLVDHNALSARLFPDAWQARVVRVIDHHEDSGMYAERADRVIELIGSCSSLVYRDVVAKAADEGVARDVARLLLGAILLDTRMLDATTTRAAAVDFAAAESLRNILGWDEDATRAEYESLSRARHDQSSFSCAQLLAKDYKQWTMGSLEVGIASFGVRFQDLLARQGTSSVNDEIVAFVDARRIDVLFMMSSFEDADADGAFARQIDVTKSSACSIELEAVMRDLGERTPLAPLRLPENDFGVFKSARAQLDVKASRKKVQPILLEILARF